MEYVRCNNCGDKLFFVKKRELRYCTCRTIALDWSFFSHTHRVLGHEKDYTMGED
jgi:hypothetical protein